MPDPDRTFVPLTFGQLPGWASDDHAEAFRALFRSCAAAPLEETPFGPLPVDAVLALGADLSRDAARAFFERHFTPHAYAGPGGPGFVTGYYEPVVEGAMEPDVRFNVPVYERPDDIVFLTSDLYRARHNTEVTAKRKVGETLVDYYTRAEIEDGALQGRGLELLYLGDWIELFYMQVQGSGLVLLPDGGSARLTFAGKNGHPYTSIGRLLVERGEVAADDIDMERVKAWLRADPLRGRPLMQENRSYVFFRIQSGDEGRDGPLGPNGVTMSPTRSLAVDASVTVLGTPIYVVADALRTDEAPNFARLMIAQDVGSAIRGPVRGDIFWGTGARAGSIAGKTRHAADFLFLMPNR